jgi:H/ACA ribonucleoprotein complex subunit 1
VLLLRLLLQIPYFNAGIFLENKTQIGKVEEILGSINNVVSGAEST